MENVTFWLALGGGIASFLSPCILPMVPVYLATLTSPGLLEHEPEVSLKRYRLFFHSLSFVLGFSLIFTSLGAIAGFTGKFISPTSSVIRNFSGWGLILIGVYMLATARFPRLNFEKHVKSAITQGGYFRSFLIGVIFTFAWTPCVSPILGSILTLAFSGNTVWHSSTLLLVYSLGLGIPFLGVGLAASAGLPLVRRINRYSIWFYVSGGAILIGVGILILFSRLSLLNG
jgi:cytochrome c-type biogenesis protein